MPKKESIISYNTNYFTYSHLIGLLPNNTLKISFLIAQLNNVLHSQLMRMNFNKNINKEEKNPLDYLDKFPVFLWHNDVKDITYFLILNSFDGQPKIKELALIPFLLFLKSNTEQNKFINNTLLSLKQIPYLRDAIEIPYKNNPYKNFFIF